MTIIIDQLVNHPNATSTTTGADYVPPGVSGTLWCHMVSTVSYDELATFLTDNVNTIGALATNIRRPIDGSFVTYIGLTPDERDQAIFAGASPQRTPTVFHSAFDYDTNSPPATYEP
jgi:hypothetical protein